MDFRFFLSDPQGSFELSPQDLEQPFLVNPSEKHPSLTLKDYFGALQQFILSDDGAVLASALNKQELSYVDLADISEVAISSEKHGAFYHIASIALNCMEKTIRFAVTTAVAETAKTSLKEEFHTMKQLALLSQDFLPEVYCKKTVICSTGSGAEEFIMMLGEWLDGYHEWHLNHNHASGKDQIQLWDYEQGYRFLSDAESFEILRQAAHILTYFYDQSSFCQIYPWHHGAGDFIVKAETGKVSVKLITVRQYEPLVQFDQAAEADCLVAAIHFLLNLSIRLRLDRLNGVDESAWINAFAVQASVAGFFDGLRATSVSNRLMLGPLTDLLEIMRSFDPQELFDMYDSLLVVYAEEDEDDFRMIREKLPAHVEELHAALQGFILK